MLIEGSSGSSGGLVGEHQPDEDEPMRDGGRWAGHGGRGERDGVGLEPRNGPRYDHSSIGPPIYINPAVFCNLGAGATFSDVVFSEGKMPIAQAAIGAVNLIAGVLGTLQSFLKVAELQESHRAASVAWSKLGRALAIELALAPDRRTACGDMLAASRKTDTLGQLVSLIRSNRSTKYTGTAGDVNVKATTAKGATTLKFTLDRSVADATPLMRNLIGTELQAKATIVKVADGEAYDAWRRVYCSSEPMSACSAALALGGGGIVRRIASPQAPALSSALGGSLVRLSSWLLSYIFKNTPFA
eukprot:COSAG06_NODE_5600_length_3369_cov_71.800306_1_plen_301_part_00